MAATYELVDQLGFGGKGEQNQIVNFHGDFGQASYDNGQVGTKVLG